MLYLAYDAEMDQSRDDSSPTDPAASGADLTEDSEERLEIVLESLVESLEDLNLSLAKAYIESVERKRAAKARKSR